MPKSIFPDIDAPPQDELPLAVLPRSAPYIQAAYSHTTAKHPPLSSLPLYSHHSILSVLLVGLYISSAISKGYRDFHSEGHLGYFVEVRNLVRCREVIFYGIDTSRDHLQRELPG